MSTAPRSPIHSEMSWSAACHIKLQMLTTDPTGFFRGPAQWLLAVWRLQDMIGFRLAKRCLVSIKRFPASTYRSASCMPSWCPTNSAEIHTHSASSGVPLAGNFPRKDGNFCFVSATSACVRQRDTIVDRAQIWGDPRVKIRRLQQAELDTQVFTGDPRSDKLLQFNWTSHLFAERLTPGKAPARIQLRGIFWPWNISAGHLGHGFE